MEKQPSAQSSLQKYISGTGAQKVGKNRYQSFESQFA